MSEYDSGDDLRKSYDVCIAAMGEKLRSFRREQIGDATLFLGDCREVLPLVGIVDHIIMDPPYEAEAHAAGRRLLSHTKTTRRSIVEAPLDFAAITDDVRAFVCEFAARTCSGWALAFCQAEAIAAWRAAFEDSGASWRRAMVWVKPDSSPQLSGDRPAQGFESIAAAWYGEGRSAWNGGGARGVFTVGKHDPGVGHGGPGNEHPTQKPIALMDTLVSLFSQPLEIVCDPFMGSGTTGVACVRNGRRFIGVEADQRYFDLACRRIEEAHRQPRLFKDEAPRMKQETLL